MLATAIETGGSTLMTHDRTDLPVGTSLGELFVSPFVPPALGLDDLPDIESASGPGQPMTDHDLIMDNVHTGTD